MFSDSQVTPLLVPCIQTASADLAARSQLLGWTLSTGNPTRLRSWNLIPSEKILDRSAWPFGRRFCDTWPILNCRISQADASRRCRVVKPLLVSIEPHIVELYQIQDRKIYKNWALIAHSITFAILKLFSSVCRFSCQLSSYRSP